jgi:hypothetical protein
MATLEPAVAVAAVTLSSSNGSAPYRPRDQENLASVKSMREIIFGSLQPPENLPSLMRKVSSDVENDIELESSRSRRPPDSRRESQRQSLLLREMMFGRSISDISPANRSTSFIEPDDDIESRMNSGSPLPQLWSTSDDESNDSVDGRTSNSPLDLKKESSILGEQQSSRFRRVRFAEDHPELLVGETLNRANPNFFEEVMLNIYDELPTVLDSNGAFRSNERRGSRVIYCDNDDKQIYVEEGEGDDDDKLDKDELLKDVIRDSLISGVVNFVGTKIVQLILKKVGNNLSDADDDDHEIANAVERNLDGAATHQERTESSFDTAGSNTESNTSSSGTESILAASATVQAAAMVSGTSASASAATASATQ